MNLRIAQGIKGSKIYEAKSTGLYQQVGGEISGSRFPYSVSCGGWIKIKMIIRSEVTTLPSERFGARMTYYQTLINPLRVEITVISCDHGHKSQ